MDVNSLKKTDLILLLFLLFVYGIVVSTPTLLSGYYSDDVPNGLTRGMVLATQQTFWGYSKSLFVMWLEMGRFFPVTIFFGNLIYYYFDTIISYQIMHTLLIWLSLIAVAWLVKLISKQLESALLVLFLIPMFWSVRNYHDPLSSFAVLLPCVTLFSALTLCFFVKAINSRNFYWHIPAMITYVLALCTYEVACVAFVAVVLLAIIMLRTYKKIIYQCLPYLIMTLLYIGLVIGMRHSVGRSVYTGISISELSRFCHTFLDQLISGLPLSYWLFSPKRYFPLPLINPNFNTWAQLLPAIVLVCLAVVPIYYLLSKVRFNQKAVKSFLAIGLTFTLIPALLMGISLRHQTQVHFGVGYLPVYIEYIGFTFLLLVALNTLRFSTSRFLRAGLSCLFGAVIGFSFFLNHYTLQIADEWEQNPRALVEHALDAGLFADVPASAILLTKNERWNVAAFYMQSKGLQVNVADVIKKMDVVDVARVPTFFMEYYVFPNSNYGYVILARVDAIHYQEKQIVNLHVLDPKVFLVSGRRRFLTFSGKKVTFDDILHLIDAKYGVSPETGIFLGKMQGSVITSLPKGEYQVTFSLSDQKGR
jgi:hypothetical protein